MSLKYVVNILVHIPVPCEVSLLSAGTYTRGTSCVQVRAYTKVPVG